MSCNNTVASSDRLFRWAAKSENKNNIFWCWLALRQKKVAATLTWWHFCEVLKLFPLWFSVDSRMLKLNSDKFDQWRVRRRMWSNVYSRLSSHKVTTRTFCLQRPTLTAGAGAKTAVGRRYLLLIPKTIGNRKRDCAWGCAWGINTTWVNLQIEKHKSGRRPFRSPNWFVLFDLQVFSGGVYSPSATSRTISFSISNSFWY